MPPSIPPPALVSRSRSPSPSRSSKKVHFAPDTKDVDTYEISARKYRRASAARPKPPPRSTQRAPVRIHVREPTPMHPRMSRTWM